MLLGNCYREDLCYVALRVRVFISLRPVLMAYSLVVIGAKGLAL